MIKRLFIIGVVISILLCAMSSINTNAYYNNYEDFGNYGLLNSVFGNTSIFRDFSNYGFGNFSGYNNFAGFGGMSSYGLGDFGVFRNAGSYGLGGFGFFGNIGSSGDFGSYKLGNFSSYNNFAGFGGMSSYGLGDFGFFGNIGGSGNFANYGFGNFNGYNAFDSFGDISSYSWNIGFGGYSDWYGNYGSGTSMGGSSGKYGCTDPEAINYDPEATKDNGSCQYPMSFEQLTDMEKQLHELINQYRGDHGLSSVPLSKSLTYVAKIHVRNLQEHHTPFDPKCNMHSWYDDSSGNWTSCCYTSDHAQAACMWNKPGELTNYTENGYENAYYYSAGATPQLALDGWKSSHGHNILILNQEIWANLTWQSMGVGIYQNYAVVWFGEETDPDGYYNY